MKVTSEGRYLYSAAIAASMLGSTDFTTLTFRADNDHEALGIALDYAKRIRYADLKYINHYATVLRVSDDLILACAKNISEVK
jgi:hypothetical protein